MSGTTNQCVSLSLSALSKKKKEGNYHELKFYHVFIVCLLLLDYKLHKRKELIWLVHCSILRA